MFVSIIEQYMCIYIYIHTHTYVRQPDEKTDRGCTPATPATPGSSRSLRAVPAPEAAPSSYCIVYTIVYCCNVFDGILLYPSASYCILVAAPAPEAAPGDILFSQGLLGAPYLGAPSL